MVQVGAPGEQPREVGRHRADRRGDGHVVVVEDDDEPRVQRAGVVHRLIGHARRHRAVADDGDDVRSSRRAGPAPTAMPSPAEMEVEECAGAEGVVLALARAG